MKIKVKEIVDGCMPVRTNGKASDCFDLMLAEDVSLKKGQIVVARLGIAVELPKDVVAKIYSRSSSPKKQGIGIANSMGFIDTAYNGNKDEWMAPLYAFRDTTLRKGTRVCQFEVQLSQFASWWSKLKWLLSSKVILKKVFKLRDKNRGGLGSTGE